MADKEHRVRFASRAWFNPFNPFHWLVLTSEYLSSQMKCQLLRVMLNVVQSFVKATDRVPLLAPKFTSPTSQTPKATETYKQQRPNEPKFVTCNRVLHAKPLELVANACPISQHVIYSLLRQSSSISITSRGVLCLAADALAVLAPASPALLLPVPSPDSPLASSSSLTCHCPES